MYDIHWWKYFPFSLPRISFSSSSFSFSWYPHCLHPHQPCFPFPVFLVPSLGLLHHKYYHLCCRHHHHQYGCHILHCFQIVIRLPIENLNQHTHDRQWVQAQEWVVRNEERATERAYSTYLIHTVSHFTGTDSAALSVWSTGTLYQHTHNEL